MDNVVKNIIFGVVDAKLAREKQNLEAQETTRSLTPEEQRKKGQVTAWQNTLKRF
ncbi:MAG: hypothetical protein JW991_03590 [Candidatus Pacebacteria bacterium]|nr:hypothetical protein [Candidatus Paceibacterota bacterium]